MNRNLKILKAIETLMTSAFLVCFGQGVSFAQHESLRVQDLIRDVARAPSAEFNHERDIAKQAVFERIDRGAEERGTFREPTRDREERIEPQAVAHEALQNEFLEKTNTEADKKVAKEMAKAIERNLEKFEDFKLASSDDFKKEFDRGHKKFEKAEKELVKDRDDRDDKLISMVREITDNKSKAESKTAFLKEELFKSDKGERDRKDDKKDEKTDSGGKSDVGKSDKSKDDTKVAEREERKEERKEEKQEERKQDNKDAR